MVESRSLEDRPEDPPFLVEYLPQDWASWDDRQLSLAWSRGYFDVNFSELCLVTFGSEYGKILDWDRDSTHLEHENDIGFPRAQLLLEAQANIMCFLRTVVDRILEGADLSQQHFANRWDQILSRSLQAFIEYFIWSSYTDQAYSKPPVLCLESLFSIAETSQRAIGDHLALLQYDSPYMRRFIYVFYDGELRWGYNDNGMAMRILQEITEDILQCWKWKWIADKCAQVKKVYDQFHQHISCSAKLQTKYSDALWALELFLFQCFQGDLKRLREGLRSRPGFFHYWKTNKTPNGSTEALQIKRRKALSFRKDPLEWCITKILEDLDDPKGYDHAMLFAFLQERITTSPRKEQGRLDELLFRRLSDMASIYHMIESIRLNRLRHGSRDISSELGQTENIRLSRNILFRPNFGHEGIGDPEAVTKALLDQMCRHTPPQGSNNLVCLRYSQSADEALGTFWAHIRKWAKVYLKHLDLQSSEEAELLGIVSVDIRTDNIHRLQIQEKKILSEIESQAKPKQVLLQTQWDPTEVQPLELEAQLLVTKVKVKSRLAPSESEIIAEQDINPPDKFDEPSQRYTYVKKNTLHVIGLMFSEISETGRESVAWEKFLQAMCDAGCVARNGGRSAVFFEATDMQSGLHRGRIIFHRPHPVAKLDPIMLRSMGKRMKKWFS